MTNYRLTRLKPIAALAIAFTTAACTPSARMRTEQRLAEIDPLKVACVSVQTPSAALTTVPKFKTERDERIFKSELRLASIYFAERMASQLKQLENPLHVKRTGTCQEGLLLRTTITEFNPGGRFTGAVTMGFAADLTIQKADTQQQLARFHLQHGKGMNAVSSAIAMASPVPLVDGVSDMPTLLNGLVEKALNAIEESFENKQAMTH
jgi:hypothetical protein